MFRGTPMVVQSVVGDPVEPGAEQGIRAPARARGDHPLPHVLEQFIGECGIAQLAQQEPMQWRAMPGVKGFECPGRTVRPGLHQGFITVRICAGAIHAVQRKRCGAGFEARRGRRHGRPRPLGEDGGHVGFNAPQAGSGLPLAAVARVILT